MPSTYCYTRHGESIPLKEFYDLLEEEFPGDRIVGMIFEYTCIGGRKMNHLLEETKKDGNEKLHNFVQKLIDEGYELGPSYSFRN